jgi:phosphate transport system substrate-binding protein
LEDQCQTQRAKVFCFFFQKKVVCHKTFTKLQSHCHHSWLGNLGGAAPGNGRPFHAPDIPLAGGPMNFRSASLAFIAGIGLTSAASAQQITGAGSTLAQPIYGKWADLSHGATGVTLNYQGVGSGAGQKLVIQRTVDFGASDAPLAADKLAAAKLLQFPTVIGAVDIAINLPGIKSDQLRLTGKLIADIYLGTVTNWNDPAIAAVNPGLKLPDLAIAPVYRADGSGTTYVFTGYLAKVSPDFKSKVGVDKAVSWPAGTGAKGTAGVAGAVRNTVGALGYVESAYATLNHLATAQLQTHDGNFVKPTPQAFAAAAAAADWTGVANFAVDMNDLPGALSWPIESATFVLLPTNPKDAARGAAVIKFFDWGLTNGDAAASGLQYVPLPEKVKTAVRTAWKTAGVTN